jgi:hypothetical protein
MQVKSNKRLNLIPPNGASRKKTISEKQHYSRQTDFDVDRQTDRQTDIRTYRQMNIELITEVVQKKYFRSLSRLWLPGN